MVRLYQQSHIVMTTKDYVYLGLMALAALVFYCHGFYSGVCRSRSLYESLKSCSTASSAFNADDDESMGEAPFSRQHMAMLPHLEVRGDYKNN